MSRAVARRILVPTWVLSYMLKLRCLSIGPCDEWQEGGGLNARTSDLLADEVTCWTIPMKLQRPPTLTLPLKGEGTLEGEETLEGAIL
jgi:hypothetical protein